MYSAMMAMGMGREVGREKSRKTSSGRMEVVRRSSSMLFAVEGGGGGGEAIFVNIHYYGIPVSQL